MGWAEWVSKVRVPRNRGLTDPYHRFETVEQVRAAAAQGVCIDVNQAGVDDWLRLPGISIHQARSLVALAQSGVPFHCLEDVAVAMGMPLHRLRPLEPILSFRYYDADSLDTIHTINPNTATVEGLSRIPKVDLYLARAIVRDRQLHGAYPNLASLQRRLGLSAELMTTLMHYLRF